MQYQISLIKDNVVVDRYTPRANPIACFIGYAFEHMPENAVFTALSKAGDLFGPFENLESLNILLNTDIQQSFGEVITSLRAQPDLLTSPTDARRANFVQITAIED